jgi:L-amino acid N-acyltransferase YncA
MTTTRSGLYSTPRGDAITIRAMVLTDEKGLLDFLRRIPADDRLYLRKDVTSAQLVAQWAENLNYSRVLPLLAIVDGQVIADATLHRDTDPERRHVGELRILIDPAYRNQGLGRFLLRRLVEIARDEDAELEKILFEVVADTEQAAQHAARAVGFVETNELSEYVKYYSGKPHDLTLMVLQLREIRPEPAHEPAEYMY